MVAAEVPTRLDPETKVPARAAQHVEKATRLAQAGMLEDALHEDQLAAKYAPQDPEIINNLGRSYANLGRLDQAIAKFTRASELSPNHPVIRRNHALALAQSGDFQAALDLLDGGTHPLLEAAKRIVLDMQLRKLVRRGLVSWSGGKPKGASSPIELTPGQPMSEWIIENRR